MRIHKYIREDSQIKVTLPPECSPDFRAPNIRLRPRRAFGFNALRLLLPSLLITLGADTDIQIMAEYGKIRSEILRLGE